MSALGISIGSSAPDFVLPDHRGGKVQLSSCLSVQAVLLIFFPFAFNDVCASEFRSLAKSREVLLGAGVASLAVSCDTPYALAQFAEREGIDIALLSDFWPHGAVAQQYGVFLEDKGFAMRASFLINRRGDVTWSMVNGPGHERDARTYEAAVATLA